MRSQCLAESHAPPSRAPSCCARSRARCSGDRYTALVTVRNTTAREMAVHATLQGTANASPAGAPDVVRTALPLPAQDVQLAPGTAKELTWQVAVPGDAFSITWEGAAEEKPAGASAASGTAGASAAGAARDRIKVSQLVAPAVPVHVLQA